MGHYTGFHMEVLLKRDMSPIDCISLIKMINPKDMGYVKHNWPKHNFFVLDRGELERADLFYCRSAYLSEDKFNIIPTLQPYNEGWILTIGSSLKNQNTIHLFLDWIKFLVDPVCYRTVVGCTKYEDDKKETPIIFTECGVYEEPSFV